MLNTSFKHQSKYRNKYASVRVSKLMRGTRLLLKERRIWWRNVFLSLSSPHWTWLKQQFFYNRSYKFANKTGEGSEILPRVKTNYNTLSPLHPSAGKQQGKWPHGSRFVWVRGYTVGTRGPWRTWNLKWAFYFVSRYLNGLSAGGSRGCWWTALYPLSVGPVIVPLLPSSVSWRMSLSGALNGILAGRMARRIRLISDLPHDFDACAEQISSQITLRSSLTRLCVIHTCGQSQQFTKTATKLLSNLRGADINLIGISNRGPRRPLFTPRGHRRRLINEFTSHLSEESPLTESPGEKSEVNSSSGENGDDRRLIMLIGKLALSLGATTAGAFTHLTWKIGPSWFIRKRGIGEICTGETNLKSGLQSKNFVNPSFVTFSRKWHRLLALYSQDNVFQEKKLREMCLT